MAPCLATRILAATALLVVCLPRASSAARPFATEDAGTAGLGVTEVEAALDMTHESACSGYSLVHGINARLDLGLGLCLDHRDGQAAYDGAEAVFKLSLVPEHLALAGSVALKAPSRSLSLGFTHAWNSVQVDLSAGSFMHLGGRPHGHYAAALSAPIGPLTLGLELRGVQDEAAGWLAGGAVPMGALMLDLGVGGSFHRGRDLTVAGGLTLPLGGR